MSSKTKKCPYCAETIMAEAIVCRFCGRDLAEELPQKRRRYFKGLSRALFVSLFLCCGIWTIGRLAGTDTDASPPATEIAENTQAPPEDTGTPLPTGTPTRTPTPTKTPTPTSTPSASATVLTNANLRGGPGTEYPIVDSAATGDELPVFARTADGWLQVDGTATTWISASLVETSTDIGSIPVTDNIPPTPTDTPPPTGTPTPNTTATARVQAARTTATAARQDILNLTATIEAYADSPPVGTWCNVNSTRGVCVGNFDYRRSLGIYSAGAGQRFIAFAVYVENGSDGTISVNPFDITFVMENGSTYAHSTATYSYSNALDAVDIAPGNNARGAIAFLVPDNLAPAEIIYQGGLFESPITISLRRPPDEE